MKIGILHLTDLHFKASDNFILNRIGNIVNAIKLTFSSVENLYIIIGGDVVDKGESTGYSHAKAFMIKLKDRIINEKPSLKLKYIIIPGNHDCNFNYDNQVRRNIIKNIGYETLGDGDDSVAELCLLVQKDFWNFYQEFNLLPENKLFFQVEDEVDNNKIIFNCLNTAWMSQKDEEKNLFLPVKHFNNIDKIIKGHINLSVFHHPIVWYKTDGDYNYRKEIQEFVEDNSSIVLCGHEHEEDHRKSIELWSNKETLYLSGKVLQNSVNKNDSGFQLLIVDLKTKTGELRSYKWEKDIYVSQKKQIEINGDQFSCKRFKHKLEYLRNIEQLKIPINVENRQNIILSDLYIYPDLERMENITKEIDSFYNSEKLIQEKNFKTCIIEGENQSGKSSLLSILYKEFIALDKYPLLIDSKVIKSNEIDKFLKKEFLNQYEGNELSFERYLQFEEKHKIILIDNLQDIALNPKTIKEIITELENRFEKVIITTNTLYGFVSRIAAEFDKIQVFSLRPLGYKKRNNLIEKYHKLSLSSESNYDEELLKLTKQSFNQVESVLGDKLMPSYPVFILSILQTLIYSKPINYEQTSYGYCYQSLIHMALAKNAKVENEYMDTFFHFLAELALHLYKKGKMSFEQEELKTFFHQYEKLYHIGFSLEKLKKYLLDSKLFVLIHEEWSFTYEYIFYFLVAKRIAELIGKEEGKKAIKYLCSNLHIEKNAKILVFIAHHTKDDFLIEEATFTAMMPFENIDPVTLEKNGTYYEMIKGIVNEISSDIIEATSNPVESRNEILERQDKIEIENEKHKKEIENDENEGLTEFMMPIFQAFRALEIVGQIIKNRKGSIPTEQLINMIIELYFTAFRTINYFGKTLLETKQDFIDSFKNKLEGDSHHKIVQKIDNFIQIFSLQICLGVFSKVIHSVGQKDLRELFIDVANKINTPAADIVTFSINSSYGNLSKDELQHIVHKYEKNPVVIEIIKARVKSYLYQNYADYKKRQSFASTLKMKIAPLRTP